MIFKIFKLIILSQSILFSASANDFESIEGIIDVEMTNQDLKIEIQTKPNRTPICKSDLNFPLSRLSGFKVSLGGRFKAFGSKCFFINHIHIQEFPFNQPAIVGTFTKKTLYHAIFEDVFGQKYEFERIPVSLTEISGPVILSIDKDTPIGDTKKWLIRSYAEYPFEKELPTTQK